MAHILGLGNLAGEQRRRAEAGAEFEGRSPASPGGRSPASPGGGSNAADRLNRSLPGPGPTDWQLPLPPVRFPLRDALMSFQDTSKPPSPRLANAAAITAEFKNPMVARHTEKSRAMKGVGRRRRKGLDWIGEEDLQLTPRAPPGIDAPKSPPRVMKGYVLDDGNVKAVPSLVHSRRQRAMRSAEAAGGATWGVLEESKSAPSLGTTSREAAVVGGEAKDDIRGTWTSAARAVLAHNRRFGGAAPGPGGSQHKSVFESDLGGQSMSSSWYGPSKQSCRSLPEPVRDWAARGLEFTDAGLGIGVRFEKELDNLAKRAPGPIYDQQVFGSVSLWSSESSSPTKQPCGKYRSAETHKIGVRRRQKPG